MGTLYQLQEPPSDLKVTLQDTFLVFPSEKTDRKSMFLSNIDKVLNFDVQTVHFFRACDDYPPQVVMEKIKNALSRVLVAYDYLAGRLRLSDDGGTGGRLEIDCDGSGVGFVVASSEYSLDEIGDLVYPNPAFRQLIVQGSGLDGLGDGDTPLCIVQVTSFKCGGFAMGISTNHATFDGISFKMFLENLASEASDKPYLAIPPCNDRRLLAARSPPQVTFPHHELLKLKVKTTGSGPDLTPPPVFDCLNDTDLDFKIFRLTSADVLSLKKNANTGTNPDTALKAKITGFNVVATHVWRCKALSSRKTSQNPDRTSTVLYAVDIRSRLDPPLPRSYSGNAVLTAYATATCKELEESPLSRLVEIVSEGAVRITDEYARSAIDWGDLYEGFPNGEFLVSSWWRLGLGQVEYPWGKPRYSCPVVYHRKDIILLFPDIEDDGESASEAAAGRDGVNVLVALPHEEMLVFEKLFNKFLA